MQSQACKVPLLTWLERTAELLYFLQREAVQAVRAWRGKFPNHPANPHYFVESDVPNAILVRRREGLGQGLQTFVRLNMSDAENLELTYQVEEEESNK